jgi:hypothetical protein
MTSSKKEPSKPSRTLRMLASGCGLALLASCAKHPPNTFTFTADLPPDFAYVAVVYYGPEKGETCTVDRRENIAPVFNSQWRTEYKPNAEITIRRTRKGCPLVIKRIALQIKSAYGKDWSDISGDEAMVFVRNDLSELDEPFRNTFNADGEHTFYGQCQWWFRTSGKPRILRKLLDCKASDPQETRGLGKAFGAYTLDQLPGKTVRMKIRLDQEERPAIGNTWVKVPNGWKRCMGDNFEDQYAFCFGNHKDFSTFQMVDGRQCTIYPDCTE